MVCLLILFEYETFSLLRLLLFLVVGWNRFDINFGGDCWVKGCILLLYIHIELQIFVVVIALLRNWSFFLRIFALCKIVAFLIWEIALILKLASIFISLNFAWCVWSAWLIRFALLNIVLNQLFDLNFLSFVEITFSLRVLAFNLWVFCCLPRFKIV